MLPDRELLHQLPHRGDMTRVAVFRPRLIALRRLFEVHQVLLVDEKQRNVGTTGLSASHTPKNSPLVSKKRSSCRTPYLSKRAGLLPVADHHSNIRSGFASHRRDPHNVVDIIHDVVFAEPVTCLASFGFPPLVVDLKVKFACS